MKTCKERIYKHLFSRISDLKKLFRAYQKGDDEEFLEYGLCFDYVAPNTFGDQSGYFRYQLSWGGPSEEFRFYANPRDSFPERIEFWLLDWFDGASIELSGDNYDLLSEIWQFFQEIGIVEAEYEKAMKF
jgi:hypothetical protein